MACAEQNWQLISLSSGYTIHGNESSPDDTVSAFSNHILNVILIRDVERDLSGSSMGRALRLSHCGSLKVFVETVSPKQQTRETFEAGEYIGS